MTILENHVKKLLSDGGTAFGTWVEFCRTPAIARMIAAAGFDFVFIDTEHSSLSMETVADICEVARGCGIAPIVRTYSAEGGLVNRIQDIGAMGLMFHDVARRSDVDEIREHMSYPPLGSRGHAILNAAYDYTDISAAAGKQIINSHMMLFIQCESVAGLENLEEMIAPGGVDVVEVGRGDLSTALGVPGETQHQKVLEAVDSVISLCDKYGVAVGTMCNTQDDAADMMRRGMRCISYANDRGILARRYRETVGFLRDTAAELGVRTISAPDGL